jgi:hypothetical protein
MIEGIYFVISRKIEAIAILRTTQRPMAEPIAETTASQARIDPASDVH